MPSNTLHFESPRLLSQLYCGDEANLSKAEKAFAVRIVTRENWLQIDGEDAGIAQCEDFFEILRLGRAQGLKLRNADYENILNAVLQGESKDMRDVFQNPIILKFHKHTIVPKTVNQKRYLQSIQKYDIVFGVGPAGTGKTYLAMAAAIQAFMEKQVSKIIVSRPAVEAGEALGFLPGDLTEKIEPYLRPLYDAAFDLLGPEQTGRLMEKGSIEIAPLAYMRGRTLSNAYVILDEAQNTTPEQMMMFLTRLGENSRMIITGDITQVDLPHFKMSGLKNALQVLTYVDGVKLFHFDHTDVVRHPLVGRIIQAYEAYRGEKSTSKTK